MSSTFQPFAFPLSSRSPAGITVDPPATTALAPSLPEGPLEEGATLAPVVLVPGIADATGGPGDTTILATLLKLLRAVLVP